MYDGGLRTRVKYGEVGVTETTTSLCSPQKDVVPEMNDKRDNRYEKVSPRRTVRDNEEKQGIRLQYKSCIERIGVIDFNIIKNDKLYGI